MKKQRARVLLLSSTAIAALLCGELHAQGPPGYYDSVDPTSESTLRTTLHAVIDDHVRFPYTSGAPDTWDILEEADEDPTNPANILDVYQNDSHAKEGGGNSNYDREHSWPNSFGFPDDGASNYAYTDCHQLFLCDISYNSSRGNKPYKNCGGGCAERTTVFNAGQGGGSGTYPGNSNWTAGAGPTGSWEAWGARRGDVARALFYMDVRYEGGLHGVTGFAEPDLILTDDIGLIAASNTGSNESVAYMGLLSVLVQWHAADPVDSIEETRNERIFESQGNRNPFVDHPEWVDCLFGTVCGGTGGNPGGPPPALPWINEFHYDNVSTDAGEFVELAGPAGTNLAGWQLLGYNGNGGAVYQTIPLLGTFPDQGGCRGTLSFAFTGLQNGAPDGMALVSPAGEVVQFLSYEGSFSATAGPALGMTSTDVGVSETSSTPLGSSLQLGGTGKEAADFAWQTVQGETPAAVNLGQSFSDGCPPVVPIQLLAVGGVASVDLAWLANTDPDLAGYRLYRGTTSGGPYLLVDPGGGALLTGTTFVDAGLMNGTTYYYVLTAVDTNDNESDFSTEAEATPELPATKVRAKRFP